jgi:hypothetical protein
LRGSSVLNSACHPVTIHTPMPSAAAPRPESGQGAGAEPMANHLETPAAILRLGFEETQPSQWFDNDPAVGALPPLLHRRHRGGHRR